MIEVLVAMVVLVTGLLALLGMLDVASHATHTNRVRQQATNVAREVTEDVRSLSYNQLATPTSIASALVPKLGGAVSGSTLSVTQSGYSFNVTFTACSLDDPSDGYGNHSAAPASGGSWCPDVAASGTTDSNPDDYKRVSTTVTPASVSGIAPTRPVQQTVLVYAREVNGPAVSCLTQAGSGCPGQNPPTIQSGTSITFNVTTTSPAYEIQWLVNGNPPKSQDPSGGNGTYTPNGATSSFTWNIPTVGGSTIDGIYSISALSLDPNGNSGTRSTLQVTVNEHMVLAPGFPSYPTSSFNAGYDQQIGGVDVQWVPSVDQDVLYYNVYHQIGGTNGAIVSACPQVTQTSCTDTSAVTRATAPSWPSATTCQSPPQSYTTSNVYWIVGVDRDPVTGVTRESTYKSNQADADVCDHPPNSPSNLTGSSSNGQLSLNWSAPSPVDPDTGDAITAWRIYRWSPSQGSTPQISVSNRLQLVGAGGGSSMVTSATDTAPDPGGAPQDYCVTAVDSHMNESQCSGVLQQ